MYRHSKKLDFTGQPIFTGIDTGKKSWEVCIMTQEFEHKTFHTTPRVEAVVSYLHRHFPGGTYKCVYEAGCLGYWIQEQFLERGVETIVVSPADVPTKGKERVRKNNRVDARKLARGLRSGDLEAIYIPSRQAQQDRTLVRMRASLVKKQTRVKNQIKALLTFYGVVLPEDICDTYWSRRYLSWLETWANQGGNQGYAMSLLLRELAGLRAMILEVSRKIRDLSRTDRYRQAATLLVSIPGVSTLSGMILLTELIDISRFENCNQLRSYIGIVPGENSTGEEESITGLPPRRNPFLRTLIIEAAWVAVRKDPAMILAFTELSARMKKNEAIIRIARKLVNRIWYVLTRNQPYQLGVVE
ncbi:MAG TPA: IS110 family transposase [Balneolales bacterium]|nr:IS110 family transposase [Balneolales bacterium]